MTFGDVIGHGAQIKVLGRFVDGQHLAHALLFSGPPGVGKRRIADALAANLLCESKGDDACGHCPACRQFAAGSHPDFFFVDLPKDKREIPIEKARELTQFLRLQAARGERKIAVIDDAHLLNLAAQNALLKALEEPPRGSLVILIAHNSDALLPTIRSRCQRVLFASLSDAEVAAILQRNGVPAAEAETLAAKAEGSPGRALRLRHTIGGAAPRLADIGGARYGALVQIASALAETEEKTAIGLEGLLRSCRDEAAARALANDDQGAAAASEAADVIAESLANLRRRSVNRQLLLEATLLRVAQRYSHGRSA